MESPAYVEDSFRKLSNSVRRHFACAEHASAEAAAEGPRVKTRLNRLLSFQ